MQFPRLGFIATLFPVFLLSASAQNFHNPSSQPKLLESFAALPLGFEQNQGQADGGVRYVARAAGYSIYLSPDGMLLAFDSRDAMQTKPELVRMSLANANQKVEPQGTNLFPGIFNYYIGNDPAKWRTGIQQFRQVRYHDVYPGVDLIFYGNRQQLEFDFGIAPGVDPSRIALRVDGARLRNSKGDLELVTPSGRVAVLKRPELYQGDRKTRHIVSGGYIVRERNEIAFETGKYDARQPLVIDPALIYSTGADPTGGGEPFAMAVDSSGAVYVTGQQSFPTNNGPLTGSAFVVKLDPTGSSLVYQTLVGGHESGRRHCVQLHRGCGAGHHDRRVWKCLFCGHD